MSRQLLLEVIPAQGPTLNATVAGENAPAIAAVAALERGRALYLWGPPGSGRSHLLRALAGLRPTLLLGAGTSASAMMALATNPTLEKAAEVIAVDDIQDLDEPQQAAVFALYNRWREVASTTSAFAIVVTGDRAPLSMSLREDLRTRLGWDLVFRLEPLSDTDKSEALATYAKKQGLPLSSDVLEWMLTHYSRDIRQLFALIDALDRYSLSKHRTITVPLVRTMLADREFLQS